MVAFFWLHGSNADRAIRICTQAGSDLENDVGDEL